MGIVVTGGVQIGDLKIGASTLPTAPGQPLPSQYTTFGNDFNRDAFAAAIADKGYDLIWEQAAYCPNRPQTGLAPRDHPIGCPICGGDGWIYFEANKTRMLITSVTIQQNYFAHGFWNRGAVQVTGLPEFRIYMYDRITMCNGIARFTELLKRDATSNLDRTKYPALEVMYIGWVNRSGVTMRFRQGEDFTINSDGYIVWSANRPDDGDYFTLAYTYHPRYVIMDLPHLYRESTIQGIHYEFPVQATAQLDYLMRDESKDAQQTSFEDPFKSGQSVQV